MERKRYISAPVYRVILFILLGAITAIWLRWLILDSGPYHWLQLAFRWVGLRESQLIGATLAYLAIFIVWLIPTVVLRYFADLPWFVGETPSPDAPLLAFRKGLRAQRQRQWDMLGRAADDPERRRFFRQMGWVGIGVGLVGALITWIIWYVNGALWDMSLVLTLVGLLGGLLSVLTGRPLLFDQGKIATLRRVVNRGVIIILILTLLFLAVMCLLEAIN